MPMVWTILACVFWLVRAAAVSAQDLGAQAAALKVIRETAADICYTVEQQGQRTDTQLTGETKAKLNGAISRIIDLGVEGSAQLKNNEYRGVLQEELSSTLKNSADCRKDVFDKLIQKMLPNLENRKSSDQEKPTNLSFIRVNSADDASGFKLDRERKLASLMPFADECKELFDVESIIDSGTLPFDVTLKNSTGRPIVLIEIGINIVKVAESNIMPLGEFGTFRIQITESYVINVPDIYGELGNKLDYKVTPQLIDYLKSHGVQPESISHLASVRDWLTEAPFEELKSLVGEPDRYRGVDVYFFLPFIQGIIGDVPVKAENISMDILRNATSVIDLNRMLYYDLPDPILLEGDAPLRLTLSLKQYIENMPNLSLIRIFVKTDMGDVFSEPVCVGYVTVRTDRPRKLSPAKSLPIPAAPVRPTFRPKSK
jgi:hypothetical protein